MHDLLPIVITLWLQLTTSTLNARREDNKHHRGVGLLLSRRANDALLGYECINEGFLTAKFQTSVKDLNVICCYGPTEDADEDEKDTFYRQIQDILNSIKKGDITLFLSDFKAKVGTDSDLWGRVIVPFGIGTCNGSGQLLLQVTTALGNLTVQLPYHAYSSISVCINYRGISLLSVPGVIQKRAAFYIANDTMCIVDGAVFRNGDPVPTDDYCEKCTCRPPGFSCVLRDCEVKPGCKAVRRDGECCPEYVCGCEHNGRVYKDGEVIRDLQNPCYTCRCHGSSISCTFADCFFRVDCVPEYVPGECCPRYDHCPPLKTSLRPITFPTIELTTYGTSTPLPSDTTTQSLEEQSTTESDTSTVTIAGSENTEEDEGDFSTLTSLHALKVEEESTYEPIEADSASTPSKHPTTISDLIIQDNSDASVDSVLTSVPESEAFGQGASISEESSDDASTYQKPHDQEVTDTILISEENQVTFVDVSKIITEETTTSSSFTIYKDLESTSKWQTDEVTEATSHSLVGENSTIRLHGDAIPTLESFTQTTLDSSEEMESESDSTFLSPYTDEDISETTLLESDFSSETNEQQTDDSSTLRSTSVDFTDDLLSFSAEEITDVSHIIDAKDLENYTKVLTQTTAGDISTDIYQADGESSEPPDQIVHDTSAPSDEISSSRPETEETEATTTKLSSLSTVDKTETHPVKETTDNAAEYSTEESNIALFDSTSEDVTDQIFETPVSDFDISAPELSSQEAESNKYLPGADKDQPSVTNQPYENVSKYSEEENVSHDTSTETIIGDSTSEFLPHIEYENADVSLDDKSSTATSSAQQLSENSAQPTTKETEETDVSSVSYETIKMNTFSVTSATTEIETEFKKTNESSAKHTDFEVSDNVTDEISLGTDGINPFLSNYTTLSAANEITDTISDLYSEEINSSSDYSANPEGIIITMEPIRDYSPQDTFKPPTAHGEERTFSSSQELNGSESNSENTNSHNTHNIPVTPTNSYEGTSRVHFIVSFTPVEVSEENISDDSPDTHTSQDGPRESVPIIASEITTHGTTLGTREDLFQLQSNASANRNYSSQENAIGTSEISYLDANHESSTENTDFEVSDNATDEISLNTDVINPFLTATAEQTTDSNYDHSVRDFIHFTVEEHFTTIPSTIYAKDLVSDSNESISDTSTLSTMATVYSDPSSDGKSKEPLSGNEHTIATEYLGVTERETTSKYATFSSNFTPTSTEQVNLNGVDDGSNIQRSNISSGVHISHNETTEETFQTVVHKNEDDNKSASVSFDVSDAFKNDTIVEVRHEQIVTEEYIEKETTQSISPYQNEEEILEYATELTDYKSDANSEKPVPNNITDASLEEGENRLSDAATHSSSDAATHSSSDTQHSELYTGEQNATGIFEEETTSYRTETVSIINTTPNFDQEGKEFTTDKTLFKDFKSSTIYYPNESEDRNPDTTGSIQLQLNETEDVLSKEEEINVLFSRETTSSEQSQSPQDSYIQESVESSSDINPELEVSLFPESVTEYAEPVPDGPEKGGELFEPTLPVLSVVNINEATEKSPNLFSSDFEDSTNENKDLTVVSSTANVFPSANESNKDSTVPVEEVLTESSSLVSPSVTDTAEKTETSDVTTEAAFSSETMATGESEESQRKTEYSEQNSVDGFDAIAITSSEKDESKVSEEIPNVEEEERVSEESGLKVTNAVHNETENYETTVIDIESAKTEQFSNGTESELSTSSTESESFGDDTFNNKIEKLFLNGTSTVVSEEDIVGKENIDGPEKGGELFEPTLPILSVVNVDEITDEMESNDTSFKKVNQAISYTTQSESSAIDGYGYITNVSSTESEVIEPADASEMLSSSLPESTVSREISSYDKEENNRITTLKPEESRLTQHSLDSEVHSEEEESKTPKEESIISDLTRDTPIPSTTTPPLPILLQQLRNQKNDSLQGTKNESSDSKEITENKIVSDDKETLKSNASFSLLSCDDAKNLSCIATVSDDQAIITTSTSTTIKEDENQLEDDQEIGETIQTSENSTEGNTVPGETDLSADSLDVFHALTGVKLDGSAVAPSASNANDSLGHITLNGDVNIGDDVIQLIEGFAVRLKENQDSFAVTSSVINVEQSENGNTDDRRDELAANVTSGDGVGKKPDQTLERNENLELISKEIESDNSSSKETFSRNVKRSIGIVTEAKIRVDTKVEESFLSKDTRHEKGVIKEIRDRKLVDSKVDTNWQPTSSKDDKESEKKSKSVGEYQTESGTIKILLRDEIEDESSDNRKRYNESSVEYVNETEAIENIQRYNESTVEYFEITESPSNRENVREEGSSFQGINSATSPSFSVAKDSFPKVQQGETDLFTSVRPSENKTLTTNGAAFATTREYSKSKDEFTSDTS